MKHFSNRPEHIDLSEERAKAYWLSRMNVSEASLKSAIRACRDVNPVIVEAYLRNQQAARKPAN